MGNTAGNQYCDNDIPRETLVPFFGPSCGYAYYKSSVTGVCDTCQNVTKKWYVTTKSRGKFYCEQCYDKYLEDIRTQNAAMLRELQNDLTLLQ